MLVLKNDSNQTPQQVWVDYFKVFEVVNLLVRFRDQRLNSWPAQTVLKH